MERLIRYLMVCVVLVAGWSCNDDKPTPTPPPNPTFTPKHALGGYLFNDFNEGFSLFSVLLSEPELTGTVDEIVPVDAGRLLWLDMFVIAEKEGILPDGTYNFFIDDGNQGKPMPDFTLVNSSALMNINADGTFDGENMGEFKDAKLVVTSSNGTYTFAFSGTLLDGSALKCEYTGKVEFIKSESGGGIFPPIERDVDAKFIEAEATYFGSAQDGAGHYSISLSEYESSGGYVGEGSVLALELISAMEPDVLAIAPGTYTVASEFSNNAKTYEAGQIQPGKLDVDRLLALGTSWTIYAIDGDSFIVSYGAIQSGTVVVALSGSEYTFTINLVDNNGNKLTGEYKGALAIKDKSRHSTLTQDYEADFSNYPCVISYWGQDYLSEGIMVDVWFVEIGTWEDGTDAVQLELWTPHGSFADKLPAAEYNVSLDWDEESAPYICLPGRLMNLSELHFSWYMGELEGGMAYATAPLVGGKVLIDEYKDEYAISIFAQDDAKNPHNVIIDWMGFPTFKDKTNAKAPQRVSRAHNILLSSNLGRVR